MRNKPVKVLIEVPIHIITPMIMYNRKNSLFYAYKNIAVAQHGNRVYVLTTAGEYKFIYKGIKIHIIQKPPTLPIIHELTDTKISAMDDKGGIENWGWFCINIWVDDDLIAEPGECYCLYDCAMDHFREIIKKDIEGDKLSEDDTTKLIRSYTL